MFAPVDLNVLRQQQHQQHYQQQQQQQQHHQQEQQNLLVQHPTDQHRLIHPSLPSHGPLQVSAQLSTIPNTAPYQFQQQQQQQQLPTLPLSLPQHHHNAQHHAHPITLIKGQNFTPNFPSMPYASAGVQHLASMDYAIVNANMLSKGDDAHSMRLLPENFVPGEFDVICGRGRRVFNHIGNERFRQLVATYLERYQHTSQKLEKSFILSEIVVAVRRATPSGGGFVKKDNDSERWYEVGDFLAREKTSQAFRDLLHEQYRSSNLAKKKRRHDETNVAALRYRSVEPVPSSTDLIAETTSSSCAESSSSSLLLPAPAPPPSLPLSLPPPSSSSSSSLSAVDCNETAAVTPPRTREVPAVTPSSSIASSKRSVANGAEMKHGHDTTVALSPLIVKSCHTASTKCTNDEVDHSDVVDDPLYFEILRGDDSARDERTRLSLLMGEIISPVKQRRRVTQKIPMNDNNNNNDDVKVLNRSCPTLSSFNHATSLDPNDRGQRHMLELDDESTNTESTGLPNSSESNARNNFEWFSNSLTSVTEESISGEYALPYSPQRRSKELDFELFSPTRFASPRRTTSHNGIAHNNRPNILTSLAQAVSALGVSNNNHNDVMLMESEDTTNAMLFDIGSSTTNEDNALFSRLEAVTTRATKNKMKDHDDPFEPVPF
jgi:hypothetical protein